ncbi:GDSL-type esterase/lipase family protein [Sunxiuqinia sp. A32]|uniref:GDSL-type esterase/lipase family protein n=1 Tax=Sunxiuqinia sp. A32 TaxID=3461496 RepID=UPI0040468101
MKSLLKLYTLVILCFATMSVKSITRVACVGASITEGAFIEDKKHFSFPGQLQTLLGDDFTVDNWGVGGTTMIKKGNLPYWNTKQYQQALDSNPDIIFIDFGGNDAKLINRPYLNEIDADCQEMIATFQQLPSHPRVIVLLPVVSFVKDTSGIWDPVILKTISPGLRQAAYEKGVEVMDMHPLLINHEELMPDKIHPNKEGSAIMANRLFELISQKRDQKFDLFSKLPESEVENFMGYECIDFSFRGKNAKVVKPKWSAPGHPWMWRMRFWGHEPQTDIALLERGFHLVYIDLAELFGNEECIQICNDFYSLLNKGGLANKATLEGMSRGGVYALNWAARNPKSVNAVYVDNPLLDMKSWPCGLGRRDPSPAEFKAFKNDYNVTSNEQLQAFKNSPIDKIQEIVKGKYPILILCADEDEAALPDENTLPFEQKILDAGGKIKVIHKPGFKHHPHSFPNPSPIIDFILAATKSNKLL